MMEEATTVVLAALLLGIAVFSVYARSIVGGLGKFLVRANVNKQNAKAQLTFGEVTLASGTKAWFSERPAEEGSHLPSLVILPGATVSMEFMGAYMSAVLQEMPGRRICIIELPHHGRNLAEDLDFSNPTSSIRGMVAYVEEVRRALGIEDNFDLMGYSLGGGIAAQYASGHPGSVRRLLLLAPYFYETAGDGFRDHMDRRDWRKVHGWESYKEMRHFFFYWLGMDPKSALPGLVLRGLANNFRSKSVRNRKEGIHCRVNSKLSNRTFKNNSRVQVGKCIGRSRVGQIVSRDINCLEGGN